MKVFFVTAVVFVFAHAASIQEQWQEFRLNYGNTYKSLLEEKRRFSIFQGRIQQYEEHNARYSRGEVSYSVGINKFADWSDEELEAYLSSMEVRPQVNLVGVHNATTFELGLESVNWVSKGYVTPVKDQMKCGSCWAFSAVGAIEGQVAKKNGSLVSLSAQNLLDCSDDNDGCLGGLMTNAFEYVSYNGILTDAEYPYIGRSEACRKTGGVKVSGYVEIAKDEAALLNALTNVGPISVAIDARFLYPYSGGIFDASSGCSTIVNHGVLAVGAGTENGKDYWLIKNSWGKEWGLDGYFKVARGQSACGIELLSSYPNL